MSLINLFWHLNVSDQTKYLILFGMIVCIAGLCLLGGKKKNSSKNKNLTKCQQNYKNCVENNIKKGTNNFCYPCFNDGTAPDFFYNHQLENWVSSDEFGGD